MTTRSSETMAEILQRIEAVFRDYTLGEVGAAGECTLVQSVILMTDDEVKAHKLLDQVSARMHDIIHMHFDVDVVKHKTVQ
jgi:hypothetical protein